MTESGEAEWLWTDSVRARPDTQAARQSDFERQVRIRLETSQSLCGVMMAQNPVNTVIYHCRHVNKFTSCQMVVHELILDYTMLLSLWSHSLSIYLPSYSTVFRQSQLKCLYFFSYLEDFNYLFEIQDVTEKLQMRIIIWGENQTTISRYVMKFL